MKVVRPICCGLDVHKTLVVATIASTGEDGIASYEQRSFGTLNPELKDLRDWLLERGCVEVCMESTGKYWIPIYNVLEAAKVKVCLTHPKYVRAIKGKKTDKKDSRWIADLFRHDLVYSSFIPPKAIRECREIARYRAKLVRVRSSEKTRYQDCMTTSNVGLGCVLSDPVGVTARSIMAELARDKAAGVRKLDEDKYRKLIRGRAKAKADRIVAAVLGCEIRSDQLFKLREAGEHIDYLDGAIDRCEAELYMRLAPYWDRVKLLGTVPGISDLSACVILSEIGLDMEVFGTAERLCNWGGLVPADNMSNGKMKSVRVSKAGQYLKPVLVQCALSAIKSTANPYFARKYRWIKERRGHKKAIVAVARMMLTCIFHMLVNGEPFNPCDLDEVLGRGHAKRKDKDSDTTTADEGAGTTPEAGNATALTEQSAIDLLRSLGYDIIRDVGS